MRKKIKIKNLTDNKYLEATDLIVLDNWNDIDYEGEAERAGAKRLGDYSLSH